MPESRNEILLLLTDHWCDWEASYVIATANSFYDYSVKTIALDDTPKTSMGNIKAMVDYTIDEYHNFDQLSMVILPGGLSWEENSYDEIAAFIKAVSSHEIPVAAICGATYFLCKHGFLNHINHTGDSLELFQNVSEYQGERFYLEAQVVVDGGFITANETAAVEFAYEIFKILKADTECEIEEWFDNFQNGAVRTNDE